MPSSKSKKITVPSETRQIMFSTLLSGVNEVQRDEDLPVHNAITEYCLSLWGLTGDDGAIKVDGSGDRGVDWYRIEDGSADVWQFKCVSDNNEESYGKSVTPGDLSDLRRIITYINNCSNPMAEQNRNAQKFQNNLLLALRADSVNESSFHVNINYVVTKNGFSKQALEEIAEIEGSIAGGINVGQFKSTVSIRVLDINDILEELWRQENESWQTYDRVREDWISLRFRGKIIDDNNCQILFAQASDLIQAYAKLGQRLFAPNVRCYLKDTAVNSNIRDSVRTTRGVDSFKYLNNGVTIIGENVDKKRISSNVFRIHRPGVINGLQTIRSLYEAYSTLSLEQREYFDNNCEVLVRVFGANKFPFDVEDLIIATNNQNKMESRNLKSNTATQKLIETQMSRLGWFYERKERAWDAFAESDGKWDTLPGVKPNAFGGRAKADRRHIDNTVVATSYLAFTGFSDRARNDKSQIFSDEKLYKRIFESETERHGFDYNFDYRVAVEKDEVRASIPAASCLLLSALIYQSVKQVTSSAAEVKRSFIDKLGIKNETSERQQVVLLDEPEYLANLMISSSPLLLTELYGYLFSKISLRNRGEAAKKILEETDLSVVFRSKNFVGLNKAMINDPGKRDYFVGLYRLMTFILSELADSAAFRSDLVSASSRPSFLHSNATRRRIFERVEELDRMCVRSGGLMKPWSEPFDQYKTVSCALVKFVEE